MLAIMSVVVLGGGVDVVSAVVGDAFLSPPPGGRCALRPLRGGGAPVSAGLCPRSKETCRDAAVAVGGAFVCHVFCHPLSRGVMDRCKDGRRAARVVFDWM